MTNEMTNKKTYSIELTEAEADELVYVVSRHTDIDPCFVNLYVKIKDALRPPYSEGTFAIIKLHELGSPTYARREEGGWVTANDIVFWDKDYPNRKVIKVLGLLKGGLTND